MNEKKTSVSYKQILDETNQLIQVSKFPEYEMMYANLPARQFTDHGDAPYLGQKCYQFMMGMKEQCPFCPMRQMEDKEEFITEIDNGKQVFTVKTKRIEWEGQEAFIEYATDITAIRRAQEIFESQMKLLVQSIPEAQGIFHLNLTRDLCLSTNGISQNVEHLKDMLNIDQLLNNIARYIPDLSMQEKFLEYFNREALIGAYYKGKTECVQEVLSYYDDNSIRWTRMTARLLMNPNSGDLECILYGMDIHDEKMYQERAAETEKEKEILLEQTKRDVLTGVYSKKTFNQLATEYMKNSSGKSFAIAFIDLDYFKNINDTLGHLAGDKVIIEAARQLQSTFPECTVVSRFGGDEFCLLIKDVTETELEKILNELVQEMRMTYEDENGVAQVSASVGAVFCEERGHDIFQLISQADKALYRAKAGGRDGFYIEKYQ